MRAMSTIALSEIAAVIGLLPLSIAAIRGQLQRPILFWLLLAVAAIGPISVVWQMMHAQWQAGLVASLWLSIAATLPLYAVVAAANRQAIRLSALLAPYLLLVALLATLADWFARTEPAMLTSIPWFAAHILLAVGSYALLTITAVAALAVVLQERAMKGHRRDWASERLPSVSASEKLQQHLLWIAAILMAAALATGAANEFLETGSFLLLTHKILLSCLAFLVIVVFLVLHQATGLRGRLAARWLLTGYLLLTLAYPGVKFVRDILLS